MVKIAVCLKSALDTTGINVDAISGNTSSMPTTKGLPRKISDFDRNALEEGIRVKEKLGGELITFTVADESAKEFIREALAIGADRGVLISQSEVPILEEVNGSSTDKSETTGLDYLAISKLLVAAILKEGGIDLILCGEVSVDWFSGQTGPRISQLLGIPQITSVKCLNIDGDLIEATKNVDGQDLVLSCPFPALVSVTKAINQPRLPNLMQIMAATSKPLNIWSLDDLAEELSKLGALKCQVSFDSLEPAPSNRKSQVCEDEEPEPAAAWLLDNLKKEGYLR